MTRATRLPRSIDDTSLNMITDTWTLPEAVAVRVIGDVDFTTASQMEDALRRALDRASTQGPPALWVDLSAVGFFSAAGLNALLRARRRAAARAVALALVAPGDRVRRVLEATGTASLFAVHQAVPALFTATDESRSVHTAQTT